ncbi:MAG: hypothetical protein M3347_08780 [Armatimonadota bacterium]|nr:hypothetical protein [Armatimonadota bacterium]
MKSTQSRRLIHVTSSVTVGAVLLAILPAQAAPTTDATGAVGQAGAAAGNVAGQVGSTAGNVAGQLPGTVGAVGDAAGNVVGGLNPTLQPIGQGVGGALNNLTQPQTIQSLLEFLASVIPNHIEAHVNLDALRVEKVTLDIRGVDLRNLRVDLLVANSRSGGQVRPAMGPGSTSGSGTTGGSYGPGGFGFGGGTGTSGTGTGSMSGSSQPFGSGFTGIGPGGEIISQGRPVQR